jgi:hypothetical protein
MMIMRSNLVQLLAIALVRFLTCRVIWQLSISAR